MAHGLATRMPIVGELGELRRTTPNGSQLYLRLRCVSHNPLTDEYRFLSLGALAQENVLGAEFAAGLAEWTAEMLLGSNPQPVATSAGPKEDCDVVKSSALNKDFWYCRTHKVECATRAGCPSGVVFDKAKKHPLDTPKMASGFGFASFHPYPGPAWFTNGSDT